MLLIRMYYQHLTLTNIVDPSFHCNIEAKTVIQIIHKNHSKNWWALYSAMLPLSLSLKNETFLDIKARDHINDARAKPHRT